MEHVNDHSAFLSSVAFMYFLALVTALSTSFVSAPYGRHVRGGWGPVIPSRLGWIAMESPAFWMTLLVFLHGSQQGSLVPRMLLGVYLFHYAHRVLVFPFRARFEGKSMPVAVAALAFLFNLFNGYLQGYQASEYGEYHWNWLFTPAWLCGSGLFVAGFVINVWADSVLFHLRTSDKDRSYKVPQGWCFQFVSCPNYLGEMLEWLGWAVMTWSWAGLAFFIYTCANLIPRACAHHAWYKKRFESYPAKRSAILPFVL